MKRFLTLHIVHALLLTQMLLQSKQPYFFMESRSTNGNEPVVDAHSNTEPPSS